MSEEEPRWEDGATRVLWCLRCPSPARFVTWTRLGQHMDERHPTDHEHHVYVTWEEEA